jgi:hypothetical protein
MSVEIRSIASERLWARHPEASIRLPMGEPPPGAWVVARREPPRNRRNRWDIFYVAPGHAAVFGRGVLVLYRPEKEGRP